MHPLTQYLKNALQNAGNPEIAAGMQAYLKTDQKFYGVQAKPRRQIFKEAAKKFPIRSREEYFQIIRELWNGEYREEMYQALEAAVHYKKFHDISSWELYENLIHTASNWDTLDWICSKLISPLILKHREYEQKLIEWRASENFWVRRAALLSHLGHKEQINTQLLAETILLLAPEKEFFIRKAIGWILREYSYTNPAWVKQFVAQYAGQLSGLSKREALKAIARQGL